MSAVGKGGRGFNGCLANPLAVGTNGGPGGSLQIGSVPVDADPLSLSGGAGGNGWPTAGKGGAVGVYRGVAPLGAKGLDGNLCPVASVLPSQINIVSDRPTGQCQNNQLGNGNITLRNLRSTPQQYSVTVVNHVGNSGIGLIPNLASIGDGVATVTGVLPGNGTHVIWYRFYPCVARDAGGDAKAELEVSIAGTTLRVPIEVDMR
jgi:hypothetical protein